MAAAAIAGVVPVSGASRSLVYIVVHGIAAIVLTTSMRRADLADRRPWWLIVAGFWCLTGSDLFWFADLVNIMSWASLVVPVWSVAASISFGFGGVLLIGGQATTHTLHRAIDASLILVASAVLAWQWWLLSSGARATKTIGHHPFAALLIGATVALVLLTTVLVHRRDPELRSVVLMGSAGSLAIGGQAFTLLVATPYDPPRVVDPLWFIATAFVLLALRDPAAAVQFRSHRTGARVATPLKLVGMALAAVINPSFMWLHDSGNNPLIVSGLGAIVSVLTLAGLWRTARLISDRDQMRNALELSERRFRSLAEHASDLTLVVDSGKMITYASPSSRRILGREPDDLQGGDLIELATPADQLLLTSFLDAIASAPEASDAMCEIRIRDANGCPRDAEIIAVNLLHSPEVAGIVLTAHDVTNMRAFEARLAHQATHDALTGLAGRHLLAEHVQKTIDDHKHRQGLSTQVGEAMVGVLFIDLDDFKTVNDNLGHDAGNRLLQIVADRLELAVGDLGVAARVGGDEFAILLRDASKLEEVRHFVSGLLHSLSEPVELDEGPICVTASIGVAISQDKPADALMRDADTAMFIAKAEGKRSYRLYDQQMYVASRKRLDRQADLRLALDESQLKVHYQRIIRLTDRATVGVEALVRWNHPTLGQLMPNEFIPLAEQCGLICDIGSFVLKQACRNISAIGDQISAIGDQISAIGDQISAIGDQISAIGDKDGSDGAYVSINVSPHQLVSARFADEIERILADNALGPERLIVEITERVLLDENPVIRQSLSHLRELGIRVALDDFGTGYSSLSLLSRRDVDIVKLDRSFAGSMVTSGRNRTLVRGILDITRSLGITTIAEGVERAEQVDDLQALGCDFAQGLHFGQPAPAELLWDKRYVAAPWPSPELLELRPS